MSRAYDSANIPTVSHDWRTVREIVLDPATALEGVGGSAACSQRERLQAPDGWIGGTREQMVGWVRDGFTPDALPGDALPLGGDRVEDPRLEYNDHSGELDRDRLAFGDFEIYSARESRRDKPGMTIEIEYSAGAETPGSELGKLGAWSGALVQALELRGYTLGVAVARVIRNTYSGGTGDYSGYVSNRIVCSRMGETTRFADWSALFSPIGYRGCLWACAAAHEAGHVPLEGTPCEDVGRMSSYGGPISVGDDIITFDDSKRILRIRWSGPDSGYRFPADRYSAALEAIVSGAGIE